MFKIQAGLYLILYLIRENVAISACNRGGLDTDLLNSITLEVHKGNGSNSMYIKSPLTDLKNIRPTILPEQDSILYIHGYMENPEVPNADTVISAYLEKGNVNVLALNWGKVAINMNYFYSAGHVTAVGKATASALEKLTDVLNLNVLHVIGHSLGAHVAGQIGRSLNVTLGRITGLDPAFPLFYPSECHITASDAAFVVILHTDAGVFGTPINTGSVDFYANNGVEPQPGCPEQPLESVYCSHQRSTKLFAKSLLDPKSFPAHKCSNPYFDDGNGIAKVFFGDNVPTNIRGTYCFTTGSDYSQ